jgi:glutathione synthase
MKNIAVQMDYPHLLNPKGDSTICLIEEAAKRGANISWYHPSSLALIGGEVRAQLQPLKITDLQSKNWYELGEAKVQSLGNSDVVLMRQDPPFDMNYITATYLLEQVAGDTLIINDPASVRSYPEKLLPLLFDNIMPESIITARREDFLEFLEIHKDIIIKPLFGWGGHSVLRLKLGGDNIGSLLEMLLAPQQGKPAHQLIAQPYLPQVQTHDVRVVLLYGSVAGAFARTPATGEVRANMRVGGVPIKVKLSSKQQQLCEEIAETLHDMGLYFAGLDFIGDYVTEINVTSPTGLRTIANLYGENPAELFWDCAEDILEK